MVGNGVTDDEFDGNALVPFVHGMGLISDDLFQVSWYTVHTPAKKKSLNTFSLMAFFFLSSKLLLIAWANTIIQVVIIVKAPLPRLIQ